MKAYAVHWFRRDLRIAGNPALSWSWKKYEGRVLGLFSFDKAFLARPDFSQNRFAFFLETLKDLKQQLEASGGDLLFLDEGPEHACKTLFENLKSAGHHLPESISYNRDYEPFAIKRDALLEKLFQSYGVQTHSEKDHLLIEPHEIAKEGSNPFYQVYSPFQRAWMKKFEQPAIQERILAQRRGLQFLKDFEHGKTESSLFKLKWKDLLPKKDAHCGTFETYHNSVLAKLDIPLPQAGSLRALEHAKGFLGSRLESYATARDVPSVAGTSQMSIYLKNGSLTAAQLISIYGLSEVKNSKSVGDKSSAARYLNELIWREFYYHILAHRPDVEHGSFQAKYDGLQWENREDYFQAWQDGMTGYPIVDAGMRQLRQTGWMHNRVRMIVASFLTKDLLIDYRWGEKHFMKLLLDGDLAPNNGGWQWAASTGCDPQPYFRIFNPVLQSERFDPEGRYIKAYIPELREFDAKEIHEPWESSRKTNYPSRIVIHADQKEKALALFKQVKS